jgi:hypothetical protein
MINNSGLYVSGMCNDLTVVAAPFGALGIACSSSGYEVADTIGFGP